MREKEKILNTADTKKNISGPVIWAAVVVILITGFFIWFGIKNPKIFGNIRDLVFTLAAIIFLLINTLVAILCFFLSAKLENARVSIDVLLSKGDMKIEELADKVTGILKGILNPFIEAQAKTAGVASVISGIKAAVRKKTDQ